jgi:glutaredoxin
MSLYKTTAMLNNHELHGDSSMIKIFSKPNCPFCEQAKQYLNNLEIEFDAIDITKNPMAHSFLVSEGHRTVPQFYQDDKLLFEGGYQKLVNFSAAQINEMIEGDPNVTEYHIQL